jgi:peptidoglycan-N-acetylglucosamine deacetylase
LQNAVDIGVLIPFSDAAFLRVEYHVNTKPICQLATWFVMSLAAVCTFTTQAQTIAFTFDDGPNLVETPRLSAKARNQAMLDALAKHAVKATLFVTVNYGANRAEGLALARAWGEAGHTIGNHTMSHPDLDSAKVSLTQYQRELLDCDAVIGTLPGYRKWFRFTYLREGNTPEKRDGMRAFLKEQSYRNAYVSLDTSDWRLDQKLIETLKKDPRADLSPIKEAYLAHIMQRAEAYRALSQRLQGRDIAQVILLHHNLINALWLDDVIAMFKQSGWTMTTPEAAFNDPVYQLQPERAAAGQSLLLSMAKSLGLWQHKGNKFDGWERLHDDGDFEIDVLKAKGF